MLSHHTLHRIAPALFTRSPGLPRALPGPEPGRWLSTLGPLVPWGQDSLGHSWRLFERYGPIVALVRGGGTRHITKSADCPGTVLCHGAEIHRTIATLHDVYQKSPLSGSLYPGDTPKPRLRPLLSFGAGLFSYNGDDHRRQRRMLGGAFSRQKLRTYCAEMAHLARRHIEPWRWGDVRDIAFEMRTLTSAIVTTTLLGRGHEDLSHAASSHLKDTLRLLGVPLTKLAAHDLPFLPYRGYVDAATKLEQKMVALIERKRRESADDEDMLSALIAARDEDGSSLTDAEILGHVSVFFAAGHETTANALTFALLLLSAFPQIAADVVEEVRGVLRGSSPSYDDLERMPLLDAVIRETLRLFPPAPWNGRVVAEDTCLAGYDLPRGTEVLFSIYQTHRNPELYRDPLAFRPERWSTLSPNPFEFCPFSAGPRTCIGAAFATMEMKIVLSLLLSTVRLELVGQRIDRFAEMVLAPHPGVFLRVAPADGKREFGARPFRGNLHEMVRFPDQVRP